MKTLAAISIGKRNSKRSHASMWHIFTALVAFATCLSLDKASCAAEPDPADEQGAQVQTRGPVHEAFAGVVTFNPEPGVVVPKAPPESIQEVPPDQKPEGENVTWIPGYWAWD